MSISDLFWYLNGKRYRDNLPVIDVDVREWYRCGRRHLIYLETLPARILHENTRKVVYMHAVEAYVPLDIAMVICNQYGCDYGCAMSCCELL